MFTNLLKKSRSKPRLRADSELLGADLVNNHTTQSYASGIMPFFPSPRPPSPPLSNRRKERFRVKKKSSAVPPPLPPKDVPLEPELTLDTNLDKMDGIIDLSALASVPPEASSPSSGFESFQSSVLGHSDYGTISSSPPTNSIFNNPQPFFSYATWDPPFAIDTRKVSPKTIPPLSSIPPPDAHPSWTPPESWWVEKEGENADEPDYSSSEGSVLGRPLSLVPNAHKRKSRRKTAIKPSKPPPGYHSYKIRIYRANTSHHVASIGLTVTVAELIPVLNQKLLTDGERETHKLYLKERGRGTQHLARFPPLSDIE
jgi:adenylate cyclase